MEQTPRTRLERAERYPLSWFKERALNSIHRIDEKSWDYSDSLLLYIPGSDKEYEGLQQKDAPYYEILTRPERAYLEHIASQVVAELPSHFNYVDLGPGTEHKEQFIFDAAKRAGKTLVYTPVDISEHFLRLSSEYAKAQGLEIQPQQVPFESLADALGPVDLPRFVSLGFTYPNYDPAYILPLLKDVAGEGGAVFVEVQVRDRVDIERMRKTYGEIVYRVVLSKLELLGLDVQNDVGDITADDGIRIWCTLRRSTPALEAQGIVPGSQLLVLQSLRYTKDALERDLAANSSSYKLFDTGETFIGAVLKP